MSSPPNISKGWIQYQRRNNNTTQVWACIFCSDRKIFQSTNELHNHANLDHRDRFPKGVSENELRSFRAKYEADSQQNKTTTESLQRKPNLDEATSKPPKPGGQTKRPYLQTTISISASQSPNIGPPTEREYSLMQVIDQSEFPPRKRAVVGDGISTGSQSPCRGSESPPPRRSSPSHILSSRPAASMQDPAGQPEEIYDIIMQPETRPISQEQLVAEVKGIYAGLVMVEAKCIEIDSKQATLGQVDGPQSNLNNEQWQAMIALHRTLIHEHHDFLLASQHPSASPALRRLASKYAMPARMWRHGIHSFLELLRHRLPASLDHMLAFIYLAYSMMALLYETVPAFEDTWIECLGDLGRYRMAIEDDDIRDREVWTGVARHWYSKASDKAPTTGRLYHHLAILARPNALQQLFYYAKSLCVVAPFTSAKESVLTLFEPVLSENNQNQYRLSPLDTAFVKAQGLLFTNTDIDKFDEGLPELLRLLSAQIGRVTRKFMEQGCHISIANSVAMLGWASHENPLMKAITPGSTSEGASANDISLSRITFQKAMQLSNSALDIVLDRIGDPNVLPYIHCTLVFMLCISRHPAAMKLLEADFPFEKLKRQLNTFEKSDRITNETFPLPEKNDSRPLPEDFALRGLSWADNYFPDTWFTGDKIDEEEKYQERPSMTAQRKERIKWIAYRIITPDGKLQYDSEKSEFHVRKEFDVCNRPSRQPPAALQKSHRKRMLPAT
ncbi:hypothetical protein B0O99DRAFT_744095 [Bisporella sp. PMI_857]|nr:hypothetical protein B0O99DRAFT_744095 [Bisporella sp. PMI_857]